MSTKSVFIKAAALLGHYLSLFLMPTPNPYHSKGVFQDTGKEPWLHGNNMSCTCQNWCASQSSQRENTTSSFNYRPVKYPLNTLFTILNSRYALYFRFFEYLLICRELDVIKIDIETDARFSFVFQAHVVLVLSFFCRAPQQSSSSSSSSRWEM